MLINPVAVEKLARLNFAKTTSRQEACLLRFNRQLGEGVTSVFKSQRHDADDTLKWTVDISDCDECEREHQRYFMHRGPLLVDYDVCVFTRELMNLYPLCGG